MSEAYWKVQAERLEAALRDSVALNKNWVAVAEPDMLEHLSEYKRVITQADEALAPQPEPADDERAEALAAFGKIAGLASPAYARSAGSVSMNEFAGLEDKVRRYIERQPEFVPGPLGVQNAAGVDMSPAQGEANESCGDHYGNS